MSTLVLVGVSGATKLDGSSGVLAITGVSLGEFGVTTLTTFTRSFSTLTCSVTEYSFGFGPSAYQSNYSNSSLASSSKSKHTQPNPPISMSSSSSMCIWPIIVSISA